MAPVVPVVHQRRGGAVARRHALLARRPPPEPTLSSPRNRSLVFPIHWQKAPSTCSATTLTKFALIGRSWTWPTGWSTQQPSWPPQLLPPVIRTVTRCLISP